MISVIFKIILVSILEVTIENIILKIINKS